MTFAIFPAAFAFLMVSFAVFGWPMILGCGLFQSVALTFALLCVPSAALTRFRGNAASPQRLAWYQLAAATAFALAVMTVWPSIWANALRHPITDFPLGKGEADFMRFSLLTLIGLAVSALPLIMWSRRHARALGQ